MTRIAPKPKSSYPWYLRLLFSSLEKKYGSILEPVLLWGRIPSVFLGFLLMQKALNRKRSTLDPQLRAMVTVKVSQVNSCSFCVDMNSYLLLQRGGSTEKMEELSQFRQSPLFTDKEKIALEYAEAMTSAKVGDELFDLLKKHFNDDEIVELTALIAFQNLSSKFNSALDVEAFGFCKKDKH